MRLPVAKPARRTASRVASVWPPRPSPPSWPRSRCSASSTAPRGRGEVPTSEVVAAVAVGAVGAAVLMVGSFRSIPVPVSATVT